MITVIKTNITLLTLSTNNNEDNIREKVLLYGLLSDNIKLAEDD